MRDFFKQELKTLHIKTGLQQYFKLSAMPDFDEQFKLLLDELVKMCDHFPLIPNPDKEKIILNCMIEDADFQGFNPKILWKWFNIANRKYLPKDQSAYVETEWKEPSAEEKQEIDKLLEDWKKSLMGAQIPEYKNLAKDIEKIKAEDKQRVERPKASGHVSPREKAVQAELDNMYLRENYNLETGKRLNCWMEKDAWIESRFPSASPEPQNQVEKG